MLITASLVVLGLLSMAAYEECQQQFTTCVPFPQKGAQETCGGAVPGGGEATAVPTASPTQSPSDVFKLLVGTYSYNANSTTCRGNENAIDPISLIIRAAYADNVTSHLIDHGLPAEAGVGDQYFLQEFGSYAACAANRIGQGSNDGLSSRWHTRGSTLAYASDPYATGTHITALTPHYDKLVTDLVPFHGCKLFDHVVPEDFYNDGQYISGFMAGRDWVANAWLASGQHSVIDIYNFDNIQQLRQCDGELPQSDGIVYHLQ